MTRGLVASVEWSRGIEDAWSRLAQWVPQVVAFLVILVIGLLGIALDALAQWLLRERVVRT